MATYFPEVDKIQFEGPQSKNPLAFRHYNAAEFVEGKSMSDWLRFAVCYWHTFRGNGTDPFGAPTLHRPWDDGTDSLDNALRRVDVAFECTGKEVCMHTSLYATKPGGKVIMVGMGTPVQTLPLSVAHLREIDILGIFRYANTYPTGIQLLCAKGRAGLPSLDDMVTHRFKGLHNASKAFDLASRTVDDDGNLVLKVVIEA